MNRRGYSPLDAKASSRMTIRITHSTWRMLLRNVSTLKGNGITSAGVVPGVFLRHTSLRTNHPRHNFGMGQLSLSKSYCIRTVSQRGVNWAAESVTRAVFVQVARLAYDSMN